MSDHQANVDVEIGSERGFGIVFTVVFLIIALWPLWGGGTVRWIPLVIAAIILALTFIAPKTLTKPNRLWFKFGMLLGAIVAPVVMFLVFITTFVPFGVVVRLFGKDLLSEKLDSSAKSYWVDRTDQPGSMKQQF
ncbi:SxtJ family membrane protein [uncultured Ruegeria sp.]|uniref:SxtJ family membrane protein n=1 Tax=uncultured Ruegeria sp. TaxID=259304 RepID=UPI00261B6A59|nr:SxtJ family membrane protein [uncultured Ruegeria sp.]